MWCQCFDVGSPVIIRLCSYIVGADLGIDNILSMIQASEKVGSTLEHVITPPV